MRGVKIAPLYDSVIERNPRKSRYSSASVRDCFLVRRVDRPAPISITRQPGAKLQEVGDVGVSIQLRLDGYALAPLEWFRERGVDPVAMRDAGKEYRETFFSVVRRVWRRRAEMLWRLRHPSGRRAVHVERV